MKPIFKDIIHYTSFAVAVGFGILIGSCNSESNPGYSQIRPYQIGVKDYNGDGIDDILVFSKAEKNLFVGVNDNGFVHYVPFDKDLESKAKDSDSKIKEYERKTRFSFDPSYKAGERK